MNNAEDMLRRVSPEGRALAHRQRAERQRRTTRQIGLILLLAIAVWLISAELRNFGASSSAAGLAAILLFVVGCAGIVATHRQKRVAIAQFASVPLPSVAARVTEWLEGQRQTLPASAQPLLDKLTRDLSALGTQLPAIEGDAPAATAIRKLIAVELPELVERYRNIPASVAPVAAAGQLVQGLTIVDAEILRISTDLASGSFDALATQNRYLQLKYDAGLSDS